MSIEILGDEARNHPEFDNHFAILIKKLTDTAHAIIALHDNTFDGPFVGGTRRVLDPDPVGLGSYLSRDMSYKIRMADIPWGGGAKGILVADPKAPDADMVVRLYAEFVHELKGIFYTGEDMNFHVREIDIMAEITPYVLGRSPGKEHKDGLKGGGDPSPSTAYGVLLGVQACLEAVYETKSFKGFSFCVSGVGATGFPIAKQLYDAGAFVLVCDKNEEAFKRVLQEMPDKNRCKVVDWQTAHKQAVDVFVPCAGGGIINDKTADEYDCKIIAGSANCIFTKLGRLAADYMHYRRKILVAPAYVINAGGIIHIYHESIGFDAEAVKRDVEKIAGRLTHIFQESKKSNTPPHRIADQIVRAKLLEERKRKLIS